MTHENVVVSLNPTNDLFKINGEGGEFILTIVSLEGKVVHAGKYNSSDSIALNSMNSGIYFLNVNAKKNSFKQLKLMVN